MAFNTTNLNDNNRRRVRIEAENLDLNTINESINGNNNRTMNRYNRSRNTYNNLDQEVKNAIKNAIDLGDTIDLSGDNNEKGIDNYIRSISNNSNNNSNNNNSNKNSNDSAKPLTTRDKFILFIVLNFYEALFGYIAAIIFSVFWYKVSGVLKIKVTDNFFDSFLKVLISITFLSTILLFIREIVDTLPIVREYKERPGFYHPPPIALTFGLFRSILPLKQRANHVSKIITDNLGINPESPWKTMNPEIIEEIRSRNPTSLIIFILIVIGLLFGEPIYNSVIELKKDLKMKFPKEYNAKKDYQES